MGEGDTNKHTFLSETLCGAGWKAAHNYLRETGRECSLIFVSSQIPRLPNNDTMTPAPFQAAHTEIEAGVPQHKRKVSSMQSG